MGGSSVKYTQHNAAQKKVDQLIYAHTHFDNTKYTWSWTMVRHDLNETQCCFQIQHPHRTL